MTCLGKSVPARQVWGNATDTLVYAEDETTYELVHIGPGGACTTMPPSFTWAAEHDISGPSFDDLWTLEHNGLATSGLGHWNGTTWSLVAKPPGNYCSMLVLGPEDIWLSSCYGDNGAEPPTAEVVHWDGSSFSSVALAFAVGDVKVWGSDQAHLWAGDGAGSVFGYRP